MILDSRTPARIMLNSPSLHFERIGLDTSPLGLDGGPLERAGVEMARSVRTRDIGDGRVHHRRICLVQTPNMTVKVQESSSIGGRLGGWCQLRNAVAGLPDPRDEYRCVDTTERSAASAMLIPKPQCGKKVEVEVEKLEELALRSYAVRPAICKGRSKDPEHQEETI